MDQAAAADGWRLPAILDNCPLIDRPQLCLNAPRPRGSNGAADAKDERMDAHHLGTTLVAVGLSALALTAAGAARADGRPDTGAAEVMQAVATTGSITGAATAPGATTAPGAAAPAEAAPRAGEALGTGARRRGRAAAVDFGHAAAVRPLIARHASEHGIPYALADAVVRLESRYNAAARNGANVGLTQISTHTARAMGYQGPHAGLLDPDTNLRYGIKYLAEAYRLARGDTCGTILRYQAGHRALAMTAAARAYSTRVRTILAGNP
jgi:soluble lytic murein transglycosylase-like protein